jgi:hypothetical protein
MTSAPSVTYAIQASIRNKPSHWQAEFADNWQTLDGTLDDLRSHVTSGGAFVAAAMSSQHRSSAAFRCADLAVVDVDHGLDLEGFAQHPLAQYACFVYTTHSHRPDAPRFRVIFRLPGRMDDPDLYKATITILTEALGGDRSCTDPCRLFYGSDSAGVPLWQPDALLPESIIQDARSKADAIATRHRLDASLYDDQTVGQACHVLEQVLSPTDDGERDRFIKITAAACSGGEALFPAWQNWASRCHHTSGHRSKQGTERYFYSFRNTRSSLLTLFYLAMQEDPEWTRTLPEELRQSAFSPPKTHSAVGYDHEDFLHGGTDSPYSWDCDAAPLALQPRDNTPGLFEEERPWAAVAAPSRPPSSSLTLNPPAPVRSAPDGPVEADDYDEDDDENPFDEDNDPGFVFGDPGSVSAAERLPDRPVPQVPRRRGQGNVSDDTVRTIRDRLNALYPGLRRNLMNQELEFGPLDAPRLVEDITTAYCRISLGAGTVYPKTTVIDIAGITAWENRVHPVQAYLTHCAGTAAPCPYFKTLASDLLGLKEDPLQNPTFTRGPEKGRLVADVILERFLIGAVARVLSPGCTHDWMPILIGSQNCGKSNFLQYLTPPSPMDPGVYPWAATIQQGIRTIKEKPHMLHAGWFVILDETERYFQRGYVEELKNLVSVSVDRSARKYENERNFKRAFVLCGATNSDDFFVDPTGNRRFMPVVVIGKVPSPDDPNTLIIDLDRLKQDRDSIWAAAYMAYQDSPVHTFSSDELKQIREYQENFRSDNPFDLRVRSILSRQHSGIHMGRSFVTMSDLYNWLEIPVDRHNSVRIPVSDALKGLGYEMKRVRIGGEPRRVWLQPESPRPT